MLHWQILLSGLVNAEWISPAPWYGRFDICPSTFNEDNGSGCWRHRLDETNYDEYCQMVNPDCAPFTCLASRVKGKLRYDLFDKNEYAVEVRDALRAEPGSKWPFHRYFTVGGQKLINSTQCYFNIGDDFFEFDFELGECGSQLRMNQATKTITYGYLFELNDEIDETIEFFVDNSIQIDCNYNTQLTLDAGSMFINQEDTYVVETAQGQLQDNFKLRVFADSQYKNEVLAHNILNMGQAVYVQIEQDKTWSTAMSGERLVWYIDTCSISNPDNTQNIKIIEDACYSDLVHAENQNLPYTKMLVDDKSKFKYTAFGFEDLDNQNYQMLSCEIRMCIQYADGSLDSACNQVVNQPCSEHYSRKEVQCDNYDEFLMKGETCKVNVEEGKTFSTVKSLSKSFKFSFNFVPDFNSFGVKRNILSLVSDDVTFLRLNMLTYQQIELCYTDLNGQEFCKNSETISLVKDEVALIKVEHIIPEELQSLGMTSAVFALTINGQHALTVLNLSPKSYEQVKIMMSDNNVPAAFGVIDDFHLFDLERNTMLLDSVEMTEEDGKITGGVPSKGQFIETFVDWGVEFSVSVDIKIHANLEHEMWGNVIHFGRGDANQDMGDRVPSIFVSPKSQGKRLFVCSSITYPNGQEEKSHCSGSGETHGEWTNVQVEQTYENEIFTYRVYFNGALAEEIRDVKVQSFGRVHLWASNPWSIPAQAEFRNLDFSQPRGRFLDEQECQGAAVEWTPWMDTKRFKRRRRKRREVEETEEENEDEIMTWLRRKNKDLCHYPSAIQAQTANGSNYTKNNLRFFSRSQGIKCTSRDQPKSSPSCDDYQTRFCCPRQPETQLDFGECEGPGKHWTEWSSIDTPHDSMGDFERYRKKERNELVYMKCDGATAWQGRTETGERSSQDKGLIFSSFGLFCHNRKQPWGRKCHDYSLRYCCVQPNKDDVMFKIDQFFNGENYTQLIDEFEEINEEQTEYTEQSFELARNRITAEISEFFNYF